MVLLKVDSDDLDQMASTGENEDPMTTDVGDTLSKPTVGGTQQTTATRANHLDFMRIADDGGLILGSSTLTGCYWIGKVLYFDQANKATNISSYSAELGNGSGVIDAQWINSSSFFMGSDSGCIGVYDVSKDSKNIQTVWEKTEHDNLVTGVDICADKVTAISVSADACVKIWNLPAQESTIRYKGHYDAILSLSCHPKDTNLFLTSSQDGHAILWDQRNLRPARRLDISPLPFEPSCIAWQIHDDNLFAVSDDSGCLVIKDVRNDGKDVIERMFQPHQRKITKITSSPMRPCLVATASEDCTVSVTDTAKESAIYKSVLHSDFVTDVIWDPHRTQIYSCSWDGTLKLHDIETNTETDCGVRNDDTAHQMDEQS